MNLNSREIIRHAEDEHVWITVKNSRGHLNLTVELFENTKYEILIKEMDASSEGISSINFILISVFYDFESLNVVQFIVK